MAAQPEQNLNLNVSKTTPTVRKACRGDWSGNDGCCGICGAHRNDHARKAGTYQLTCSGPDNDPRYHVLAQCFVFRNGLLISQARGATIASAVLEARRNVRNARKCGGL
jgi:hypothetical protein